MPYHFSALPKHLICHNLVLVNKDLGRFERGTGGKATADVQRHRAGGSLVKAPLPAPKDVENIVVARAMHPDYDDLNWYEDVVGKGIGLATIQYLDVDGNPYGKRTARKVLLQEFDDFIESDVDSGEVTNIGLVLSPWSNRAE